MRMYVFSEIIWRALSSEIYSNSVVHLSTNFADCVLRIFELIIIKTLFIHRFHTRRLCSNMGHIPYYLKGNYFYLITLTVHEITTQGRRIKKKM